MSYADDIPPPAATATQTAWESCDHCQAPLAEGQRYCVACGSRRPQVDDPAARYFVESARRARTVAAVPAASAPAAPPNRGFRTAALFALLPIVAALGIVIGRNGSNDNELLVEALKAQKAPIVNVGSGGGVAEEESGDEGGGDKGGGGDAADGKVLNRTAYGSARQLTGAKATPEQLQESKDALKKIVESKGKEYVEQQRGLPDQIIIP